MTGYKRNTFNGLRKKRVGKGMVGKRNCYGARRLTRKELVEWREAINKAMYAKMGKTWRRRK